MKRSIEARIRPVDGPTLTALGLIVWVGPGGGVAWAQTPDAELAACAAIEREDTRLACYDRVIRGRAQAESAVEAREPAGPTIPDRAPAAPIPAPVRAATPEPVRAATPEPVRAATPEPVRAATPEPAATRTPEPVPPRSEPASGPVAEPASPAVAEPRVGRDSAPAPETVPVEAFPETRAERRAARRTARNEASGPFSVVIVEYVENLSGLGVFVADTGEIYDQVSVRSSRIPDVPFVAELEAASRGSYWLTSESGGRAVRVVRRD